MPRTAAFTVENNFTRGLITEATGLNFPENACTETYDCVFDEKSIVSRRLGFDYEEGYTSAVMGTSLTDKVIQEYVWNNVAGQGGLSFVVVQFGSTLHFYEIDEDGVLSQNKKSFTYDLTNQSVSGAPNPQTELCQFTTGNGYLFVVHPYCEPFYIAYDSSLGSIDASAITIYIRDFEGTDDGLAVDARPSTLSNAHKYNLYNQGWYVQNIATETGSKAVLTYWDEVRTDYPSNSDIWWLHRAADDDVDFSEFKSENGNTAAPKGHYVLKAFYQDRSGVSGVSGISVVSSSYYRPSATAFFAGRVFYAGVPQVGFNNRIYFSQIIEGEDQFGKCYQASDPTTEQNSDLNPSDGGVIVVLEAANILKMVPIRNSLLVFCSNGVWSVSGSQGQGFTANDYSVSKISSISALSATSFVDVLGIPVWWNTDGIYTMTIDPQLETLNIQSLTDKTIETPFFSDIPIASKQYAKGAYNPLTKTIQWLYRSTAPTTVAQRFQYNRVLNLNTVSGAFYPWTITGTPVISGIIAIKGFGLSRDNEVVTDQNGNSVTTGAGNVTVETLTEFSLNTIFDYLTIFLSSGNYRLTFSQTRDEEYRDWFSYDSTGTDYESYLVTGFKVHGNAAKVFQNNYIFVYMLTEADSSLYVQGFWDYATSENTGRASTRQQAYANVSNYSYQTRKLKIRGQGKALQLKFVSETAKPFNLIGWATFETANTLP